MTLDVRDIRIGYDGRMVLHGLDFQVKQGQVLTIIGPNGVGKTTLLRCINAMLKPQTGAVLIEHADVFKMRAGEIAKRMGYVAQRNEAGRMTAFDAVLLGRKPHLSWRVSEDDLRKVDAALHQLDLQHLALRHIDEMSGGELQKVCIARALVQEPSVLLLDEPTSSLDLKNQLSMLELLKKIVREHHVAALLSLHDLNTALRFADRLLFLKDGVIQGVEVPGEVPEELVRQVYGVSVHLISHKGIPLVVPC